MSTKFVLTQYSPQGQARTAAAAADTPAEYFFDGSMFTIGSDEANDIVIAGSAAEQAVIVREDEHLTLINGADGTLLNEQPLRREAIQPLADGDRIRIGNYLILVVENGKEQPFETTRLVMPPAAAAAMDAENEFVRRGADEAPSSPQPEKTRQNGTEAAAKPKSSRNFAAVLDTLRTEEDSFYFIVSDGARETGRVLLERPEMPIGTDAAGNLAFQIEQISAILAVARKDWSGILLEPQGRNSVLVNGEIVEGARRLRNEDRVSFSAPVKNVLTLHEPSLLVALEPLLSARANGGAPAGGGAGGALATTGAGGQAAAAARPKVPLFERRFFGHFSFVETVSMILGTLIAAVLFFLFFEFMFS